MKLDFILTKNFQEKVGMAIVAGTTLLLGKKAYDGIKALKKSAK